MKKATLLTALLIGFLLKAQETDFKRLTLMLNFDTVSKEVLGTVSLTFDYKITEDSVRDSIYLNGINMEYKMLSLNAGQSKYGNDEKGIWLLPNKGDLKSKDNTLVIHYKCKPRRGIFFTGWGDVSKESQRQIWTQGQGIEHRHWIPYKDDQTDKLITEMIVSFDSTYQVISNGELVMKSKNNYVDGEVVWHYRMKDPHPGYLMMIGIGKYDKKGTKSKSGVSLSQYYYPEREGDYNVYYNHNEEIFNFMEREIGIAYPWQNYKQVPVKDFQHGAMENTSATILGDFFLVDEIASNDRNYTYVNAHELAHQWFGNFVTAESSEHHWLHEGFATYYQWLSEKNLYGEDFFDWERYKAAQLVFEASKMDTVPLGNGKAGSNRFYQKGAWVLYMLDRSLEHDVYRKVIQHYLKNNSFGVVTTKNLNSSILAITGTDYSKFFDQWIYWPEEPSISAKWLTIEDTIASINISVGSKPFDFEPLALKLVYANDSSYTQKIAWPQPFNVDGIPEVKYTIENFVIKNRHALKYWTLESNMGLLGHIEEEKPIEMWEAQYQLSEGLLDKYYAVKALRDFKIEKKADLLVSIVKDKREFYSIRAEALSQLLEEGHQEGSKLLNHSLQSQDIQLQKETLKLVERPTSEQKKWIVKLRSGNSYDLRVEAIHKSIDGEKLENNNWLLDETLYKEPGFPSHQVAITALTYRVLIYKDTSALEVLKSYCNPSFDFMTRIEAMNALRSIQYFDKDMLADYFQAMFYFNRRLARVARANMLAYTNNPEYKKWIEDYAKANSANWQDFEKRLFKRTFGLNLD